jgi:hypothetical protein
LELQPAIKIPTTSNETIASKKKTPELTPEPGHDGPSGITEKPTKTARKITKGASLNSVAVSFCRNNIFFLNQLNKICNGLNNTVRSGFHRPKPVLNERRNFTLGINNKQGIKQNEREE